MAGDDDSLLREIDFLILAAEQSGDSRDSIRLILASLRDINARIKRVGDEVNALRLDLHRQVASSESLPALDARLRSVEAKTVVNSDLAALLNRLEAEWRRTKFVLVSLFVMGGVFTLLLFIAMVWVQVYVLNP